MAATQQIAVPAQQRVGGDDRLGSTKVYSGETVQERREQRAVGPGELWLVDLPLQHGQLVAQRQDLGIFVAIAHRQQSYQGEHARQSQG
jgi:hypothetical protein